MPPKFNVANSVQIPKDCVRVPESYRGAVGIILDVHEAIDPALRQYWVDFPRPICRQLIYESLLEPASN